MIHQYCIGFHFALLSIEKPFYRKDSTGKDRHNSLLEMLHLENSFSDNNGNLQVFAGSQHAQSENFHGWFESSGAEVGMSDMLWLEKIRL